MALSVATGVLLGTVSTASAAEVKDFFDAKYYAEKYEDLKAAFGYDYDMLYDHYQTYGQQEGRNALSQVAMEEQAAVPSCPAVGEYREDLGDGNYVIYEVENNIRRKETFYTADNKKESICIYNSNGQPTEETYYDTVTGEMVHKLTTTYDEAGNILETVDYDVASDLTVRYMYEYENGLNTQVSEYQNDVYVGKTLCIYNEQKWLVKEISKNNSDETRGVTTYEYYTSGALKKRTSYYGDSDKIEMEYEYYENGYMKSEVLYDTEGIKTGEVTLDEQGNETYRYPAE